jgi:hypothetical protein
MCFFFLILNFKNVYKKYDGAIMVKWIAFMNKHADIPLSTEQIIDEFSVRARRINFHFD